MKGHRVGAHEAFKEEWEGGLAKFCAHMRMHHANLPRTSTLMAVPCQYSYSATHHNVRRMEHYEGHALHAELDP